MRLAPFPQSLALLVLALVACSDGPAAPSGTTRIRLINATSGSGGLELRADGLSVLAGVLPGQASGFVQVPASTAVLEVRQTASGLSQPLAITLADQGMYAVTAVGNDQSLIASLATIAPADTGRAVPGRANLRAINLAGSQPAPEVDIHVTAPGASLAGATPAWQMNTILALYSGLKDFAPGNLQVRITLRGTTTVVATSAILSVGPDQIRVITLRHIGGGSFELGVAAESGQ